MSLFSGPKEHAANPPKTWEVVKVADRVWHLRPAGSDYPLETFKTKREAENGRVEGPSARLWQTEDRWYKGGEVPGWRPWAECQGAQSDVSDEGER